MSGLMTNDVTECCDEDWMDWTGALIDWSYGSLGAWTGMVTRTGMTVVGMTTGVVEVTPLALQLSQPQQPLHPAALPRAQLVSLAWSPARMHGRQTCQRFTQL